MLPLRLVWLGPIFTLVGGGSSVGSIAFFAITSDITPDAKRTDIFFLAAATNLIAELIAPSTKTQSSLFTTVKHQLSTHPPDFSILNLNPPLRTSNSAPRHLHHPIVQQPIRRYLPPLHQQPLSLSSPFQLLPLVPPRRRANHPVPTRSFLPIACHDCPSPYPLLKERPLLGQGLNTHPHPRFHLNRRIHNAAIGGLRNGGLYLGYGIYLPNTLPNNDAGRSAAHWTAVCGGGGYRDDRKADRGTRFCAALHYETEIERRLGWVSHVAWQG
ncbi:hypothetical protein SBOR_3589 [Sclerotinia borealis F-4128]|uniref:Uncharacterized protein n=1 Tax=Sclerotinia borealis (strain F-4128) TaxID=1432307 RepID=W9CJH2_SCLBF|nr:hypothetical protein SBOR_3589 [Sclerotinia borealis F-4128]